MLPRVDPAVLRSVAGAVLLASGGHMAMGALRSAFATPIAPEVAAFERVVAHAALADVLSSIARLVGGGAPVRDLLRSVDEFLRLDAEPLGGPPMQGRMCRLSGDVVRKARCMRPAPEEPDMLAALLDLRDEHVPRLTGVLDDILHNHLLDAQDAPPLGLVDPVCGPVSSSLQEVLL
jgi:hypothetical protein